MSKGHPFHILIIKDNQQVLHLVNTFSKFAGDFIQRNSKNLIKADPKCFFDNKNHYNNVLYVWANLSPKVDWIETMLRDDLVYRT